MQTRTLVTREYVLDGTTAVVRLNRPDSANAVIPRMAEELRETFEALREVNDVRVVVLTGAGRHFCAGADRRELQRLESEGGDWAERLSSILREQVGPLQVATQIIHDFDRPVIAAVNGAAFGGGFDLALACHYRVAADGASLSSQYANLGIPPMDGGAWLVPRLTSPSRALWLLASAARMDADQALEWGLVDEVVPAGTSVDRALEMADVLRSRNPRLIEFLMREIRRFGQITLTDAHERIQKEGPAFAADDEHLRAVRSFG